MDSIEMALIAEAIKEIGPISSIIRSKGIKFFNKMAVTFGNCFQEHVNSTFNRCSRMKNIIYRDQSVDFLSQYVSTLFSFSNEKISDEEVLFKAISGNQIILCGTAGAGKTMFMRWIALNLISNLRKYKKVPLYVEMRYFENAFANDSLEKYLFTSTSSVNDTVSYDIFISGIKSGLFVILLDAIDEIKPELRDKFTSHIMSFLHSYPKCGIIISSRFDDKIQSIQQLTVLRTNPMDKNQIISVISKIDYDKNVKDRLIERLDRDLYDDLSEFLSNPLLATIMLLAFDHSADIPTKLTLFYRQAFEALYQRHDAAKGAYRRHLSAELPIDKFETIFSTFSFFTYSEFKFRFTDSELFDYFRQALSYVQTDIEPGLVINDSMVAACLLQKDGLDTTFTHRSFQEYFCANFLSKYRESRISDLIESIASKENQQNVLRMLYEIAPEVLEYEWILPKLKWFITKFGKTNFHTVRGLERIFIMMFESIMVDKVNSTVMALAYPESKSDVLYGINSGLRWMSIIERCTNYKVSLYRQIFQKQIWDDRDKIIDLIPDHTKPDFSDSNRYSPAPYDGDVFLLNVFPSDARWLIYSKLPMLFDEIRIAVQRYYDELTLRRTIKKSSIINILGRNQ